MPPLTGLAAGAWGAISTNIPLLTELPHGAWNTVSSIIPLLLAELRNGSAEAARELCPQPRQGQHIRRNEPK